MVTVAMFLLAVMTVCAVGHTLRNTKAWWVPGSILAFAGGMLFLFPPMRNDPTLVGSFWRTHTHTSQGLLGAILMLLAAGLLVMWWATRRIESMKPRDFPEARVVRGH